MGKIKKTIKTSFFTYFIAVSYPNIINSFYSSYYQSFKVFKEFLSAYMILDKSNANLLAPVRAR